MKLVYFDDYKLGVVKGDRVVDVSSVVRDIPHTGPGDLINRLIARFDQYRGKGVEPGKKSLALRIVMQDTDRTLTDSEVEEVVASIREQLDQQFKAKPRT